MMGKPSIEGSMINCYKIRRIGAPHPFRYFVLPINLQIPLPKINPQSKDL